MNAIAIEPYKALIVAMLEQAIRDSRHGQSEVRQSAQLSWSRLQPCWLLHDPCCADLCEMIDLNLEELTKALNRELVST